MVSEMSILQIIMLKIRMAGRSPQKWEYPSKSRMVGRSEFDMTVIIDLQYICSYVTVGYKSNTSATFILFKMMLTSYLSLPIKGILKPASSVHSNKPHLLPFVVQCHDPRVAGVCPWAGISAAWPADSPSTRPLQLRHEGGALS